MIKDLIAKAKAATPGDWDAYFAFGSSDLPCEIRNDKDNTIVVWDESCDGHCTADARFISAANPETILALCEALSMAREALEFYQKVPARRKHSCETGFIWIDNDQGQKAQEALAEIKRLGF